MKKGVLALVGGLIGAMLTPIGARAAVDTDVSDAIRYHEDDSLGEYVDSLEGRDDEEELIGLDWTFNAFGEPANALCVSTNGTVAPIFLDDDQMDAWGGIGDDDTDVAPEDPESGTADEFVDCETYDSDMQEASNEDEVDYFSPLGSDIVYDWEGENGGCITCIGGAIYWDETEINSHNAVIVTWDEVSMYSTINSDYEAYVDGAGTWDGEDWESGDWQQAKRNTFQLVIIQGDGGSDEAGYDVTIEFNYGTMGDGSDGYGTLLDRRGDPVTWWTDSPDPDVPPFEEDFDCNESRYLVLDDTMDVTDLTLDEFNEILDDNRLALHFDSLEEAFAWDRGTLCRWAIGFGDFDPNSGESTGYQLFTDTPIPDLLDGGDSALVENSRNSDVPGRYVFEMVDGAIDLDPMESACARCTGAGKHRGGGSSGGGSSTETPETPTEEPAGAVTAAGGRALLPGTLQPVGPVTRRDGQVPSASPGQVETLIDAVAGVSSISSDGSGTWSTSGEGYSVSIGAGGSSVPAVGADGTISVSGQFAPGTLVDIWLFSTPTFLGSFYVPADGSFSTSLTLPAGVASGDHTLQVNGTSSSGHAVSANIGLRVNDRVVNLPKTGSGDTLGLVAVWLLAAGVFLVSARRRRSA